MFGNIADLLARIPANERVIDVKILACRPADLTVLPDHIREKFASEAFGPGSVDSKCERCECAVVLGPRQAIAYDLTPDNFIIMCLLCTSISNMLIGDEQTRIRHFGGVS